MCCGALLGKSYIWTLIKIIYRPVLNMAKRGNNIVRPHVIYDTARTNCRIKDL